MELDEAKDVVIAGFLHDLLEDTDCKLDEIKSEFGERATMLVVACTFDRNLKDYKERWRGLISNIKQAGRDALVIKLIDQIENLPYYRLISDDEKKQEVMWKHKFFIDEYRNDLKELPVFKNYEKMVNSYELVK
ncbi:MAG: GTP pyrophosphokinase [candidate division WS2 bacterium]|nr:GTP pyrophosphokinase [Candidatus Lithacetigena glycinireducens]